MVDSRNYTEECVGVGQRYLVNVEPLGCDIDKDENGDCTAHNCVQSHCDDIANANEALTMTVDASSQCPRCVNYSGTLQDTFSCVASVGAFGCGFEQHLEATYLALQDDNIPNAGFLREDAFLAVVLVTDEDDCSTHDPTNLFDVDDPTYGFGNDIRCFTFGIAYDQGGETVGPRTNCAPSEDATSMLHPISRYTAFLEATRPPERLLVASIAGPFDGDAAVADESGAPVVAPSCIDGINRGKPGIRLKAFTAHFNDPADMDPWAFANICTADFGTVLTNIGNTIVARMSRRCVQERIRGCPQGVDGTACSHCLPWCDIFDVEARSTPQQRKRRIPWCGRVCETGVCMAGDLSPCEFDQNNRCVCTAPEHPTRVGMEEGCATLHYPGGIPPDDRDPDLASVLSRTEPTCTGVNPECPPGTDGQAAACWYLERDINCPFSVNLRIVRAQIPPPGTFVEGGCADPLVTEDVCDDGLDNDEDCLVDDQDPDCQQ